MTVYLSWGRLWLLFIQAKSFGLIFRHQFFNLGFTATGLVARIFCVGWDYCGVNSLKLFFTWVVCGVILLSSVAEAVELKLETKIGGYGQGKGQFSKISSLTGFQNMIAVGDSRKGTVQVFSRHGQYLFELDGVVDDGDKLRFDTVTDVAQGSKGQLFVLDSESSVVYAFNRVTEYLYDFGGFGKGPQSFNDPDDIYVDKTGRVWIADTRNNRILKLTDEGQHIMAITPSDFSLSSPKKVELRGSINPVVLDRNGLHLFSDTGRYVSTLFEDDSLFSFTFFDESKAFVTFSDRKGLFLLDLKHNKIEFLIEIDESSLVDVDGKKLFVAQPSIRSVWVYDVHAE